MGPLAGLRVIEMAGIGPCPLAGQLLADMGAEVIVIDRRGGERTGRDVNRRGKKSLALNLKHDEGKAIVLDLAATADLLIEGFRPGVMERLGLGPDMCSARNGGLIFGRITGWGQEGPLAHSAGHDINYLAITGLLNAIGDRDRPPVPPLNIGADYGGGALFLVMGVLAALFERARSGKGQVVDAAMVDGAPAMLGLIHTMLAAGSWSTERGANLLDGAAPFYRCYRTADGRFVSVGALEPQFFEALVGQLGLDRCWLAQRMEQARWSELRALLEDIFATRTRDEWAAEFEGTDCCVAPVLDWDEAPRHAQMAARGTLTEAGGVMQAAPAPRFSRSDTSVNAPPPATGGDTDALLLELGYEAGAVARLREAGAVT